LVPYPTYSKNVPVFCINVPTFYRNVPPFWYNVLTFCKNVPTFYRNVLPFWYNVPTFYKDVPTFWYIVPVFWYIVPATGRSLLFGIGIGLKPGNFAIPFWNGLKPHSNSICWKPSYELPPASAGDISYGGDTPALA